MNVLHLLAFYPVAFGLVFALYRLALAGKIGRLPRLVALDVFRVVCWLAGVGRMGFGPVWDTYSLEARYMLARNPNFVAALAGWRRVQQFLRFDLNDWASFRKFLMSCRYPDPGALPPPEWPNGMGAYHSTLDELLQGHDAPPSAPTSAA